MTSSRAGSDVRGHVRSIEGDRVEMRCSFRVLFAREATRVKKVDWTLNGLTLIASRRINISTDRQADHNGFWNSTLTFDPLVRSFSGQFNYVADRKRCSNRGDVTATNILLKMLLYQLHLKSVHYDWVFQLLLSVHYDCELSVVYAICTQEQAEWVSIEFNSPPRCTFCLCRRRTLILARRETQLKLNILSLKRN